MIYLSLISYNSPSKYYNSSISNNDDNKNYDNYDNNSNSNNDNDSNNDNNNDNNNNWINCERSPYNFIARHYIITENWNKNA